MAIADSAAQALHDRASRGLPLTESERQDLRDWYAFQDQTEGDLIVHRGQSPLVDLRARIEESAVQLRAAVDRIQALTAENETLQHEIEALQGQLAGRLPTAHA